MQLWVIFMPWLNDDLILFHGCTEDSLQPHNARGIAIGTSLHGINPAYGANDTDFGLGFYTTSWKAQAASWANLRQLKRVAMDPGYNYSAVLLAFAVKRNELAQLESLVFTHERTNYWPFIEYCRTGGRPHGRTDWPASHYDVVYGPVSLWTQMFVINNADQVSFHTPAAALAIKNVSIAATGTPLLPFLE